MTWLTALVALIKLLGSLAQSLRDRGLVSSAQARIIADVLEAQANEVDIGRKARLDQRAIDVGGVPDDRDEFQRDQ